MRFHFVVAACLLIVTSAYQTGCGNPCSLDVTCGSEFCSRCLNTATNETVSHKDEHGYCVRGLPEDEKCIESSDCFFQNSDNKKVVCKDGECKASSPVQRSWLGFIAVAIAVCAFGSNFLPVKKYDTGDGVFFQWVMCVIIFLMGLFVNLYRGCPQFHPYAMVGGVLWCTGNMCVVPVVRCIGLGLGLCLWASTNLLMGWASGSFGLFGVSKASLTHPALNYVGVAMAMGATIIYAFIRPTEQEEGYKNVDESLPTVHGVDMVNETENRYLLTKVKPPTWDERLTKSQKRILGITLALISGLFYGVNFDPPASLADQFIKKGLHGVVQYSNNPLDYIFAHFCGILLASTFYLIVYCIYMRNLPAVHPYIILPGFTSGILWAIGQISWFVANGNLSLAVSFPLICVGPGMVGSLWGVLLFGEIKGRRNIGLLLAAFAVTIAAVTIIAFSQI